MARRKTGKKTPRQGLGFQPMLPMAFKVQFQACCNQFDEEEYDQAYLQLERLGEAYPRQVEVWILMMLVGAQSENPFMLLQAGERLLELEPDNVDGLVAAFTGRMHYQCLYLAVELARHLSKIAPTHELLKGLDPESFTPLPDEVDEERLRWERVQLLRVQGKSAAAVSKAREIVGENPTTETDCVLFAFTLLSDLQSEEALRLLKESARAFPENYRLLERLTYVALMRDDQQQVEACRALLRNARFVRTDTRRTEPLFEALARLEDDEGILAAWKHLAPAGVRSLRNEDDPAGASICHWVAIALQRRGKSAEASRVWEKGLRLFPDLDIISENIEDAALPPSEVNGPWAFDLHEWLPQGIWEPLVIRLDVGQAALEEVKQRAQQLVSAFPGLLSTLLEKGNNQARRFALVVVGLLDQKPGWDAVSTFCQGERGASEFRARARLVLQKMGKNVDVIAFPDLLELEITDESSYPLVHGDAVLNLLEQGILAQRRNEWKKAESLFRQALQLEPNAPDVKNNIASVLVHLDRQDEAMSLLLDLHQHYPAYLYGQINYSSLLISEGRLEEADAILTPMLTRKRFHFEEIKHFIHGFARLKLAQKELDVARSWVEMLAKIDPLANQLPSLQQQLLLADLKNKPRKPFIARPS